MSTVNTMADVQTGREVVSSDSLPSELTEPKFTAQQIETDCPDVLKRIGKEITARIKKAGKQIEQAQNHSISVDKLIAQARELCNDGGFTAFQRMFFPDLGKSRVYELLAIGTNKKSAEETRADTRSRVAKHRANKAADAQFRYSNGSSEPDEQGTIKEPDEIEAPSIASQQSTEPAKPRNGVAPGNEALSGFTVRVLELNRTTENRPPGRFFKTAVPVEVLERVGNLLINIAKHKKFDAVEATPAVALRGNVSDEQPAEDTSAERPVQDAEELRP
jgi:hypothetical protein